MPTAEEILLGRMAVCSYGKKGGKYATENHGTPVASSVNLAFFEYRGEGSKSATEKCANCGYYKVAHDLPLVDDRGRPRGKDICDSFAPHGAYEYDEYYCGCWGWD